MNWPVFPGSVAHDGALEESQTLFKFFLFFFKRKPQRNQSSEMSFVPNQSYILVKATDMSSFTSQMRKTSVPTFEQIKLRVN